MERGGEIPFFNKFKAENLENQVVESVYHKEKMVLDL